MPNLDIETIKQAAQGRWPEILESIGGVDRQTLDGRHYPCPKCGGDDRFRMIDEAAGALLCNQCFATGNGDGIAALQWLLGCDFITAAGKLGDYLGVKPAKETRSDPEKDLEFLEWSANLVPHLAMKRPGITEDALLRAGARRAKYKRTYMVYALPIIGESLNPEKPVGWVMIEAMGGTLPKWDRKGNIVGDVKVKMTAGSKPGFVGLHAIERLAVTGLPEVIWKVEGVTDLLAMLAAIPEGQQERHLVLTNANGASESPKWMASVLARSKPLVLHDADEPGEVGAKNWAKEITRHGVETIIVRLPYEIEETHGKDVRDYLNDGHTYQDLLARVPLGDVCRPVTEGEQKEAGAEFPTQELILKRLQLEILYEDRGGGVRVFSTLLRKSSTFEKLSKVSEIDIIQAAGEPAMLHISSDPDGTNTWNIADIRKALAIVASSRRGRSDDRGVGIWQGIDENGANNDSIILANDTEAARWNGDRVLRRVLHPRVDGIVIDFGDESEDWYDYERLQGYTAQAHESTEWRTAAIQKSVDLFSRWHWRNEGDPELVVGLIMATWLQTIWAWRPLVCVIGESNCGKSTLFETLGGKGGQHGLFGGLAFSGAKSSEAGIRQGISNTGRVMLLDEFEKSKDREAILATLRASSRGDTVHKGTASQRSLSFTMRHIAWVAAIESGLHRQPDINRFVKLELLEAKKDQHGKLVAPPAGELVDLGLRLLATGLVRANEAKKLAVELKATKIAGAPSRSIETYAVPAAILGRALDFDRPRTEQLLEDLMAGVIERQDGDPEQKDQELLLEAIMQASVQCDHGKRWTVGQIIESYKESGTVYREVAKDLERHGIALREETMAIHRGMACRMLLPNTEWQSIRIDEVLCRVIGAERTSVRFAGQPLRCVSLPLPELTA